MEITWIIAATFCTILLAKIFDFLYKRYVFHEAIDKIPGFKAYPIIGSALEFSRVPRQDFFEWLMKRLGEYEEGICQTWLGEMATIHITKAQNLELILPSTTLITKSSVYDYIVPWLGTGLLTSTGQKWHSHRRMITPAFHFSILEQSVLMMTEKANILVECIVKELRKNPGKPIDIFVLANRCTLDVICDSAMGINIDAQRQHNSEYLTAIESVSRLAFERIFQPWLQPNWIFYRTSCGKEFTDKVNITHKFAMQVIRDRKLARLDEKKTIHQDMDEEIVGKRKHKAFLDILLDASEREKQPLTDEELMEEVSTFMFAGHDTTAAAFSWALFCLGNSPEVQEKVHRELEDVFGDSTELATQKQLSQLKYLERVMKESLRLYPSAPSISRSITEDIEIRGYKIPKGAVLSIHIYSIHRDPDCWPNANLFDPDRFLSENAKGRHSYAYIPFSAGPRNCIGQKYAMLEEKVLLTALLRKWRVKSTLSYQEMKCHGDIILKPQDCISLNFTAK